MNPRISLVNKSKLALECRTHLIIGSSELNRSYCIVRYISKYSGYPNSTVQLGRLLSGSQVGRVSGVRLVRLLSGSQVGKLSGVTGDHYKLPSNYPLLQDPVRFQQIRMPFKYSARMNYPDYKSLQHKCMVGRHLTPEMYERLFTKTTPNGVTLDKCIQPSVDNAGRIIGLVAGDPESYEVFKELFDAVINEKHGGFGPSDKHPPPDLNPDKLVGGTFDPKYVKSCRIRTGRSLKGFCLPPSITRAERREVERILVEAVSGLGGDLAGKYYPLKSMTPEEERQLIADHFLFQKPTGHLMVNSGAVRDWPDARGIWHNLEKTFLIWINEEDQCRVISMQSGSDLKGTFERFCRGLTQIADLMKKNNQEFAWSERLGYICTCPSNLGTGLRCSVHIQLHKLCKHPKFEDIVLGLHLQKRGTGGEHTEAVDDVYDISNRARLKKSEREFVQLVIDGVTRLIEMEQRLEAGGDISDLLPQNCK